MLNKSLKPGFQLIELGIVMVILAIVYSLSIPIGHWGRATHGRLLAGSLKNLLEYAQVYAAKHQERVTVCPLNDHERCVSEWGTASIGVFAGHRLIRTMRVPEPLTLRYEGFPNSECLEIHSTGESISNGHFTVYCGATPCQQVIMNTGGRVRVQVKTNVTSP